MANNVYDKEQPDDKIQSGSSIRHDTTGNRSYSYKRSSGTGRSGGWARGFGPNSAGTSGSDLKRAEEGTGASGSDSSTPGSSDSSGVGATDLRRNEEGTDDSGGLSSGFSDDEGNTKKKQGRFQITRRKAAAGITTLILAGTGFFGMSITQGPMEFVHLGETLSKHLRLNEEFGDDRSSKLMIYAMLGKTEQGRMGAAMNKYADKWEQRMVKKSGLRPVYNKSTGRLAGFEVISDKNNRQDVIKEVLAKNPELAKAFDQLTENGGQIRRLGDTPNADNLRGTARKGSSPEIGKGNFVIDLRTLNERGYKLRRDFTKQVGRSVVKSKVASAISSRVLIKRGGVNFHFLNNAKKKVDNTLDANQRLKNDEEYEKGVFKRWATSVRQGVSSNKRTQTDRDGDPENGQDTTRDGQSASDSTNAAADEIAEAADNGEDTKAIKRQILTRAGGGAALAVGAFCAVKDMGQQVENYKYTNNVLPMMRMGWGAINISNAVKFGTGGVNADELKAMSKLLHDQETGKSWNQAESIQALFGKEGGDPIPEAARLNSVADKPDLFEIVDRIAGAVPGLGLACDAFKFLGGLPVIRDIAGAASDLATGAVDTTVLKPLGTSVDEIMLAGLSAMAGDSVNPLAKGSEFGSLADTGAFLAANDQAIALGGTALNPTEVAQLNDEARQDEQIEYSKKPLLARYFDPYDPASISGKAIDIMPNTSSNLAALLNPLRVAGNLANAFAPPGAKAAVAYDYGVHKYGTPAADRDNPAFDDPYENEAIVEPQLAALNDKYGKCFGVTIGPSGELQYDKAVNILKLEKDSEFADCRNDKNLEIFKRYKLYVGDMTLSKSLGCWEGDAAACAEVGNEGYSATTGSESEGTSASSGELPSGSAQDLAKKLKKYIDEGKVSCNGDQGASCPDIQKTASGESIKNSSCYVDSLDPALVGMLLKLAEMGHTFVLSAICSDHPSNPNSLHHQGKGVDFNYIDGVFIGPNDVQWDAQKIKVGKKLNQDIASFMPKGTGFGQVQCHPTFDFLESFSEFQDVCHHQHIQVK